MDASCGVALKLLILVGLMVSHGSVNAQSPSIAIGPFTGEALDFQWGLNGEDAFKVTAGNDPAVWPFVEEIDPDIIRFPGGTVASFYHPNGDGYGLVLAQIQQQVGDVENHMMLSYTDEQQLISEGNLDQNYLQDMIDLAQGTQVKVLYCANILTGTTAEALAVLQELIDAGVDVVGVELGNEAYLPDYAAVYPTAQDYLDAALPFNDAIKAQYPTMKVSLAAAPPAILNNEDALHAAVIAAWDNTLASATWADAVALHAYPEMSVQCPQTDLAGNLECALTFSSSFAQARMDSALNYLTDVVDKEVWMTEWNVRGPWSNYGNSLVQGLFCAEMFQTISRHPTVRIAILHNFLSDDQSYNVLRRQDGPIFSPMLDFPVLQALAPIFRNGSLIRPVTISGMEQVEVAAFADPNSQHQDLLVVNWSDSSFTLGGLDMPAISGTAWMVGGISSSEGTAPNEMSAVGVLGLQTVALADIHSLLIPKYAVAMVEWNYDGPFGIGELQHRQVVHVFPDPVADRATLTWDLATSGKVIVQLVSSLGHVVRVWNLGTVESGQHQITLPMDGVPSGTYALRCVLGGRAEVISFVKL